MHVSGELKNEKVQNGFITNMTVSTSGSVVVRSHDTIYIQVRQNWTQTYLFLLRLVPNELLYHLSNLAECRTLCRLKIPAQLHDCVARKPKCAEKLKKIHCRYFHQPPPLCFCFVLFCFVLCLMLDLEIHTYKLTEFVSVENQRKTCRRKW